MENAATSKPELEFDECGLLANPDDWNEEVARAIAEQDQIGSLTEDHWKIIHGLREYFAKHGAPPSQGRICVTRGLEQVCVRKLFGSCFEAWKVAGLPDPGDAGKAELAAGEDSVPCSEIA